MVEVAATYPPALPLQPDPVLAWIRSSSLVVLSRTNLGVVMKILVFGTGVIGSIYGHVLTQAGNDVTHYVRPGKARALQGGQCEARRRAVLQ